MFKKMRKTTLLWLGSCLLLVAFAGMGGYWFGHRGYTLQLEKGGGAVKIINQQPPSEQVVDFSLFWQVWESLNKDYLFQPLDPKELMYGALSGLTQAAGDPFTTFLSPQQSETMSNRLNGRYEGIGAELAIRDDKLLIVAPLDGSPAKVAGVRSGDEILLIDDEVVAGMTLIGAVSKIRGPAGEAVNLTLRREEGDPFTVSVTRAQITLESISAWRLEDFANIGYIRIARFGETTKSEWDAALTKVIGEAPELMGIILDVRGNPGGYFQGAVQLASDFMDPGTLVVVEEFGNGVTSRMLSLPGARLRGLPVVVLIDKGSASSSEILAVALRENIGAILVGETSFGKGTVQEAREYADGSGLHITTAKWLSPRGDWFHDVGLTPDVVVEIPVPSSEADDALGDTGTDVQLDKAVEVLQGLL